jgi:hypothetical protein
MSAEMKNVRRDIKNIQTANSQHMPSINDRSMKTGANPTTFEFTTTSVEVGLGVFHST